MRVFLFLLVFSSCVAQKKYELLEDYTVFDTRNEGINMDDAANDTTLYQTVIWHDGGAAIVPTRKQYCKSDTLWVLTVYEHDFMWHYVFESEVSSYFYVAERLYDPGVTFDIEPVQVIR